MSDIVYVVDAGCTWCNTCVFECPSGAITMQLDGATIDAQRCSGCGCCAEHCASEAIHPQPSAPQPTEHERIPS